jgi:1,2-diacylglycerol 3-beta-galactosyltransferase
VLGYCDNIPELMRASDLLVTKAGPGAIAEASLAEVPVVVYDFVPGQEYGNLKYVEKNGIGVVALTTGDVVRSVRRIVGNLERLQTMRDCQASVAPRGSSRRIAELIANLACGERSAAPPPKKPARARAVAL